MAKKREKKTVYTGITSEQMEQAFADYAKADARQWPREYGSSVLRCQACPAFQKVT